MQVQDVMIPSAGCVDVDTTLREAAEKMKSLNLDPIPVCDEGRVIGVLNGDDLRAAAEQGLLATASKPVREAMKPGVICCRDEDDIESALAQLENQPGARAGARVPVVNRERHLVGIVSLEDLRKREALVAEDVNAVENVESVSSLVHFDDDPVDYMSDESFPASDPVPPPSSLGAYQSDEKSDRA